MIKYSEILVHIVCATKNILKTPKNIRRYDFYSYLCIRKIIFARLLTQYYVKNLKTLWHTATYVYNSPLRCTLQHLADDIENS